MNDTILTRLFDHASSTPDKVAYTFLEHGESLQRACSYSQLLDRVSAIAYYLRVHGYSGERALMLYANPLEFVEAFLGCLAAGVIAVPVAVPSAKSVDAVTEVARNANVRCIIAGAREQQKLEPAITAAYGPIPWHGCAQFDEVLASASRLSAADVVASNDERIAFLQYTSGSLGAPKGVMVSHRNLMVNEAIIGEAMRIHRDSVIVTWLPHYHDMGLIGNLLQPLYQGAHSVVMQPTDFVQKPIRWLRALSAYGGTISGAPNFAYDLCVSRTTPEQREGLDLHLWDVAYVGAEPVRPATIDAFVRTFAQYGMRTSSIFPCYGMAESTLFVTGEDQGNGPTTFVLSDRALGVGASVETAVADAKSGVAFVGCGRTRHDSVVRIVHPETRCELEPGVIGEIWVRGESVAMGYFNNALATLDSFGATIGGEGSQTYLRTGDLGTLLGGQLVIVGRLKDLLIVRGANFHPHDIEATALRADSDLAPGGGAIFQCAPPNDEKIVLVHELTRQGVRQADFAGLAEALRAVISERHGIVPSDIVLIRPGQLPRTTSGKVRRSMCRELFEQGRLEPLGSTELAPV